MLVIVTEDKYWTGEYAVLGGLDNGIEVDTLPEEKDALKQKSYKLNDDNTWVFDEEKYQSLLEKKNSAKATREKKKEIAQLEKQISGTDYKIIKCYEYSLVGEELPYDVTALHTERQAIRDEINSLEAELSSIEEGKA